MSLTPDLRAELDRCEREVYRLMAARDVASAKVDAFKATHAVLSVDDVSHVRGLATIANECARLIEEHLNTINAIRWLIARGIV
jgi:hypothetical protein